jgi:hypothetical protein
MVKPAGLTLATIATCAQQGFASLGAPDEAWGIVKLTPEQLEMLIGAEPMSFPPARGGSAALPTFD